MLNPYKLSRTVLIHQIYGFNQNLSADLGIWSSAITDSDGLLHSDIRVTSIGGALKIEKWEKGRCIHRVLITHYNQVKDPAERKVGELP